MSRLSRTCKQFIPAIVLLGAVAIVSAAERMTSGSAGMMDHRAHSALMESMNKMNAAMEKAKMTGDPDHDFASMMIPHHQGAIDMAKIEIEFGKDSRLREMAKGMIEAQEREIKEMKEILEKLGASDKPNSEPTRNSEMKH